MINCTKKNVYIIGHRNPDTDSVVSAAAYARLKQEAGETDYIAARAGKITPQTEYIFNRFKVPVPVYVPDLIPKTSYYMSGGCETVNEHTSLWGAIAKMEDCDKKALPVVDDSGKYKALLHYNSFARSVLHLLDPQKQTAVLTSASLIQSTLNAQPLITKDADTLMKSSILVAASDFESFKKMLDSHKSENLIVIAGDRADVHEYCIESKIRTLVITSGFVLKKELREKAEKAGLSVLASPYDTSSTAMLIVYSTPVIATADTSTNPVKATDRLVKVRPLLAQSPSRCLPVVDDDNKVIGLIEENDLVHEANIEAILVDHNELTQAVEGIENYKIREIIDHHRLGTITTKQPITFINKPVGATCTLVANLYREKRISIPREIASILLCGILADTLGLQSITTTDIDRETAEYLSNITDLDIKTLETDITKASSKLDDVPTSDIIHQDMKEYKEGKFVYTVSQIESVTPDRLLSRKEDFIKNLEDERQAHKAVFSALMVTDITRLTSILIAAVDPTYSQVIDFPKQEENVYVLADIVSRKKQLVPLLSEQVEKLG
ncbi:MAG: putative manganese-dependent inorganic diphosphatase [Treponemataceae bacterium]|nr:putative manganese-dependent inorganic diphosphatase [Treponemataceae bacterium]